MSETTETVMFGAGCFWGVEHTFRQVPGVVEATCGYSGGHLEDPTYQQVCNGDTGHAEVVQVRYDPQRVSFEKLLETFWGCHDPTQVNRQGPDVGSQYRSAIFYTTPEQQRAAAESRTRLEQRGKDIATEIAEAGPFYRAEEYHQRYFEKNNIAACPTSRR